MIWVHDSGKRLLVFQFNGQWNYTPPFWSNMLRFGIVYASMWVTMCVFPIDSTRTVFEHTYEHTEQLEACEDQLAEFDKKKCIGL